MTQRITCCVIFVTLIWGGHTQDEENVRDMLKSNMTRNDFSNLLQSLIKLNEQRVSVLHKLYRLQDNGVLSEVLRSGDKKTGDGSPNNLFLIVMSKNPNDPSRRKIGFQLTDSVTSLNAGSNNDHLKLDYVLDPAGFLSQNIRKENRLESIFENFPRVGPTKKHRADSGTKKETLKFDKPDLRTEIKHNSNVLRAATSLKANEDRTPHKINSRFEIISNKRISPNTSEKLQDYNGNSNKHPQTVGYSSQSNENLEIDFTTENYKLTSKPIIIKHIITGNRQNSKNPLRGKNFPFSNVDNDHSRQYTKMISDISIEKHHVHKDYNPKINKYTPKRKVQSNQQKNKLTTKPIIIKDILSNNHKKSKYPLEGKNEQDEDNYDSPSNRNKNDHNSRYTKMISDISNEKHHENNHNNLKTHKYTPKVKYTIQSNRQKNKLTTKLILIKDLISSKLKHSKYPLEDKYEQDDYEYASPFSRNENDHNSPFTKIISDISIEKHPGNNRDSHIKTNKYTPKVKVQSNQQKDKLTTNPIIIKDILSNKHKNSKYPLEDKDERDEDYYGSPFSNIENDYNSQHTNINSDIPLKELYVKNHNNPKTDKNIPKVQRNQGNKYLNIKTALITNMTSNNNQVIKNLTLNNDKTKANNQDLNYTSIKDEYATKEIGNDNKFPSLANKNVYGSKLVTPEETEDRQYGSYPDFEVNKDVRDNSKKDMLKIDKVTPVGYYPGFENLKDVTDNSNKDKVKSAKDMPFGNYPGFEHQKDVRGNSKKHKPKTAIDAPSGNFHGFEHHKNVMKNLNKDKPNTAKELHYRDNANVESKKDPDYYGVKMFDNGKRSVEEFSVFITNVGNGTADEVKQQNDPKFNQHAFDQPKRKPVARKPFIKCLKKKAIKLCCKSCISAYKNVCRKLKCTSRSKKALKSECKRSCKKTFASSSSKYSDEGSDDEASENDSSDESYSDTDSS